MENSLATEMLKELKSQSKRKDIIIVILIAVIVSMIIGFFVYEGQFETLETQEQSIESTENSTNTIYTQTIN